MTDSSKQTLQSSAEARVPQGVQTSLLVSAGASALEILIQVLNLEAALIVIATHGHGGWRYFLVGEGGGKAGEAGDQPCSGRPWGLNEMEIQAGKTLFK